VRGVPFLYDYGTWGSITSSQWGLKMNLVHILAVIKAFLNSDFTVLK